MKNQRTSKRLVVVVLWMAVLMAGALGLAPLVPLAPPADAGPADFSVAAAFDHIERIAQEPRPIGSPASLRARADIVAELEQMGLEPQIQLTEAPGYYYGAPERVEIGTVLARIPGTEPDMAVALVGHYDTVPGTPGANDNASAVAILLEVTRAVLAGPPLRHDVLLVFMDAEEPAPRFGSTALVNEHPWARDIGFVINLEASGSSGPSMMIAMNGPGGWIIDQVRRSLPYPAVHSFLTTTVDLIGASYSDFSTFRAQRILGVEFSYLRGSSIYHTAADTPDRVSLRSLHQQGANTLALIRQIGNLASAPDPGGSAATFFNVGRFQIVRYPNGWVLPLALLAGAVLAAVAWRQRAWLRTLAGAALTILVTLLTAAAATGLWAVLADWRSMPGVAESYLYLAGLLALAIAIELAVTRWVRRRLGEGPDATGVVLVWWVLGLLTALLAPGMSYLFAWPALAGALALLGRTWARDGRWQPVLSMPVLGAVLVLLPSVVETFYQMVQPRPGNTDSQMLVLVAIPVAMLALAVALFRVFPLRTAEQPSPVAARAPEVGSRRRQEQQAGGGAELPEGAV